jgi:hypothetical protein
MQDFGGEGDENKLDEDVRWDEIHDGEFAAYRTARCTTLRRRQLNAPERRRGSG